MVQVVALKARTAAHRMTIPHRLAGVVVARLRAAQVAQAMTGFSSREGRPITPMAMAQAVVAVGLVARVDATRKATPCQAVAVDQATSIQTMLLAPSPQGKVRVLAMMNSGDLTGSGALETARLAEMVTFESPSKASILSSELARLTYGLCLALQTSKQSLRVSRPGATGTVTIEHAQMSRSSPANPSPTTGTTTVRSLSAVVWAGRWPTRTSALLKYSCWQAGERLGCGGGAEGGAMTLQLMAT